MNPLFHFSSPRSSATSRTTVCTSGTVARRSGFTSRSLMRLSSQGTSAQVCSQELTGRFDISCSVLMIGDGYYITFSILEFLLV